LSLMLVGEIVLGMLVVFGGLAWFLFGWLQK
jgi:hypothetical protein